MNTETISIKEGDKLIAEFMGYKYIPDGDTFYNKEDMYFSDQLEYHSSWDWLMPVVELAKKLSVEFLYKKAQEQKRKNLFVK